jgi:two-component system response regulator NreC
MKRVQVLLADDHAVLRAGLRLLVDAEPDLTVVAEAADGPEAIAKARRAHPDIVVLDLSMPRTDPASTIRQLSRLGARTVVLTMHDDPAYVGAALAAGADGYVVKKAADVELLAAIRAVSRGCRFLDASAGRARPARRAVAPPPGRLSAREEQVLSLVAHGFTNREAAERLGLSVKTVETFRARVCEKLGLRSRADLVGYALRMGLVAVEGAVPGADEPRATRDRSR